MITWIRERYNRVLDWAALLFVALMFDRLRTPIRRRWWHR